MEIDGTVAVWNSAINTVLLSTKVQEEEQEDHWSTVNSSAGAVGDSSFQDADLSTPQHGSKHWELVLKQLEQHHFMSTSQHDGTNEQIDSNQTFVTSSSTGGSSKMNSVTAESGQSTQSSTMERRGLARNLEQHGYLPSLDDYIPNASSSCISSLVAQSTSSYDVKSSSKHSQLSEDDTESQRIQAVVHGSEGNENGASQVEPTSSNAKETVEDPPWNVTEEAVDFWKREIEVHPDDLQRMVGSRSDLDYVDDAILSNSSHHSETEPESAHEVNQSYGERVSPIGETGFAYMTRPRLSPSRVQKEIQLMPLFTADGSEALHSPVERADDFTSKKQLIAEVASKLREAVEHRRLSLRSTGSRLSHPSSHSPLNKTELQPEKKTMPLPSLASVDGGVTTSDDLDTGDSESDISDLSDDVVTYVDMEHALANAKEVFGFNGSPVRTGDTSKVKLASKLSAPPIQPYVVPPVADVEPLSDPLVEHSKSPMNAPKHAPFEPTIPSFAHLILPEDDRPTDDSVEIQLDIYVAPLFASTLPDDEMRKIDGRPRMPAKRFSRRNLWSSFSMRNIKGPQKVDPRASTRNNPTTMTTHDGEIASVASQESDVSELAIHLEHEYETASVVEDERDSAPLKKPRTDEFLYALLRSRRKRRPNNVKQLYDVQLAVDRTDAQQTCCANLKRRWMERYPNEPFPDDMILRFALTAPKGKFHEASAWRRMKRFDRRYLTLTANGMEKQLMTKTLFPIPGIETKEGNKCFYMRPSRYFPRETTVVEIIDNQCYVMNTMNESEYNATNGIGFIANMDGWKFENFEVKYCFCFMMALQGRAVPTRVTHFLIVNPPTWFGKIWSIMKTMLAPSFQKKVKMIPESELSQYLKPGYEDFLPDDMSTGRAPTEKIVQDFVAHRQQVENKETAGSNNHPAVGSEHEQHSVTVASF